MVDSRLVRASATHSQKPGPREPVLVHQSTFKSLPLRFFTSYLSGFGLDETWIVKKNTARIFSRTKAVSLDGRLCIIVAHQEQEAKDPRGAAGG